MFVGQKPAEPRRGDVETRDPFASALRAFLSL